MAAAVVVLAGASLRLVLGGGWVGAMSATVMSVLIAAGVWTGTRLLGGARAALIVTAILMALFNLAALPARNPLEYDDLEALYRTDQQLSVRLFSSAESTQLITVVAQAVFAGARPGFGLGGTINGASVTWDCPFARGVQRLALTVPQGTASPVDVALRLTGSPSRESDYLVIYASSKRGGPLITLESSANVGQGAIVCSLA